MWKIKSRNWSAVLLVMAVAAVVFALWFAGDMIAGHNRFALQQELAAVEEHRALDVRGEEFLVGSRDARVVVVEYSDLECPYCKMFNERMPYFVDRFKDQSVAFAFRHFPLEYLHKQAPQEAVALECAGMLKGSDAFFRFRDMVYANSKGNDSLDLALLPQFAEELGINKDAFAACREGDEAARRVNEDIVSGAILDVYSTPSLVLYKDGVFQYILRGGSAVGWRNLEVAIENLLQE